MGCAQSTPTFYHADLLAVLRCEITSWKGDRARQWYNSPLLTGDPVWNVHHGTATAPARPRDPDWSKNSPVATEIVDILNGALKAMGGAQASYMLRRRRRGRHVYAAANGGGIQHSVQEIKRGEALR